MAARGRAERPALEVIRRGQLIPAEQRERLIALMKAGVKPDLTWIAHELPAGTTLDRVPAPKKSRVQQMDARLGKTIDSEDLVESGSDGSSPFTRRVNHAVTASDAVRALTHPSRAARTYIVDAIAKLALG